MDIESEATAAPPPANLACFLEASQYVYPDGKIRKHLTPNGWKTASESMSYWGVIILGTLVVLCVGLALAAAAINYIFLPIVN